MPTIKNIIIFITVGVVIVLIYIFFFKPGPSVAPLVSSNPIVATSNTTATVESNEVMAKDFLTLLLNVKNIKLKDTIFSDPAFISLHDSSITLTPDGTEGRANPFAPLGTDTADTGTPAKSF